MTDMQLDARATADAQLFHEAPAGYLVASVDGVVRRANRYASGLLGVARPLLVGRRLRSLVVSDDRDKLRRAIDLAVSSGRRVAVDLTLLAGGEDVDENSGAVLVPVRALMSAGRVDVEAGATQVRVLLLDLGEVDAQLARAERQVIDAHQDLADARQVIRWQATMLGAAFHDLRTPLAVMKSTIETLLVHGDELGQDRAGVLLLRGQEHAARLERIIDSLARFSREQLGAQALNRRSHRIDEMTRQLVKTLKLDGHQVTLDFDHLWMDVDRDQMERVLDNLIRNAVNHTPAGTTISVSTRLVGQADLLVVVSDDGPGIPDGTKERIFLPFYSTASDRGGTGLGLAIVGMFAAMHGGRVWVDDAESGGAAFQVLLPEAAIDGPSPD